MPMAEVMLQVGAANGILLDINASWVHFTAIQSEGEAVPDAAEEITAANLESILAAAATLVRAGSARAGKLTDFAQELLTYTSPVHVGQ